MRTTITRFAFLWALLAIACQTSAQTIAEKDIPLFVGAFSRPDPLNTDSFDVSHFVVWYIDSLDSNGARTCFGNEGPVESAEKKWLTLQSKAEHSRVCNSSWIDNPYDHCRFYILSDVHGWVHRWDALTIWREKKGTDSLEFMTARFDYGMSFGSSWIEHLTVFPDGSLLLHTRSMGADDEVWGGDCFQRGDSLFNFRTFWSSDWESDQPQRTYVVADRLCAPVYDVILVEGFMSADSLRNVFNEPILRTQSASATPLDLWKLAKEFFQLKDD